MRLFSLLSTGLFLLPGLLLLGARESAALQFTPDADDRLNTFQSTDPGTPFNTGPGGVDYDGAATADPHPGEAVVTGQIPVLNYYDGTAQASVDFSTVGTSATIDFQLEAQLLSAAVDILSPTQAVFTATFGGTADGQPDLVLTDPDDGDAILLESNLVSGVLGSTPVAPITVQSGIFDPNSVPSQPNLQAFAFFQTVVSGNPWEILFSDDIGTLNDSSIAQALVSNFLPDFSMIADELETNGDLPSFEAEVNGFVFALESSQFQVPEPATGWLLAGAAAALAWTRRRRA